MTLDHAAPTDAATLERPEVVALNADVVGYSSLIADDLEGTTATMEAYHALVEREVHEGVLTCQLEGDPGPLIAALQGVPMADLLIEPARLEAMERNAIKQEFSAEGDRKLLLNAEDKQSLGDAMIGGITYIPTYKGLEADFFRERFGEPAAWKVEDEENVQWFYPQKGLTLLLSTDGSEILQYRMPRAFVMPDGVETLPAE